QLVPKRTREWDLNCTIVVHVPNFGPAQAKKPASKAMISGRYSWPLAHLLFQTPKVLDHFHGLPGYLAVRRLKARFDSRTRNLFGNYSVKRRDLQRICQYVQRSAAQPSFSRVARMQKLK